MKLDVDQICEMAGVPRRKGPAAARTVQELINALQRFNPKARVIAVADDLDPGQVLVQIEDGRVVIVGSTNDL